MLEKSLEKLQHRWINGSPFSIYSSTDKNHRFSIIPQSSIPETSNLELARTSNGGVKKL